MRELIKLVENKCFFLFAPNTVIPVLRQLKGTSAHLHALKFQLNEARFQAYAPTNGKGKNCCQLNEPVCGSR
jgi:hypothetical protein